MSRVLATLLTVLACAIAAPVSAQSAALIGTSIAPLAQPSAPPEGDNAGLAAIRPQLEPSATPVWQAPYVDHQFRNYRQGIAQYGPFVVLDSRRVALVGVTDRSTPAMFSAMLHDFPALAQLDMVECPGTHDDIANIRLGRMIRAAGMVTYVPPIGSVRSGAVELFFAGVARDISDGAEFAVHSWRDDDGHEAKDFAADAPENTKYLDYYREMGMGADQAQAFYTFTNSVPHSSARWLTAPDMRRWAGEAAVQQVARERPQPAPQPGPKMAPKLAYADMTFS
jgi:hypothetical protein